MDDGKIECARCGEKFYYELTRCPSCGVNIYPEDELENHPKDDRAAIVMGAIATPLHSTLLVLAAWVVSVGLALAVYVPVRWAFSDQPNDITLRLLVSLAVAAGAFAGGYLSARFARMRRLELGVIVGVFSIFVTFALLARDFSDLLGALMSPVTIFGWGAIVLAAYGGAWLATGQVRAQMADELFAFVKNETQLYQDLLARCGHDEAITERMIEYERRRVPKANRAELIRLATERWDRDNRRSYTNDLDH